MLNANSDLIHFSSVFKTRIPQKPYCSNELGRLSVCKKDTAIKRLYIQHNPPTHIQALVLDVDKEFAAIAWDLAYLPPPNWSCQNRENGHAHLGYFLQTPVCTTEYGSRKALDYLAKIQAGFTRELKADTGYSGLITKNPLHGDWRTTIWRKEPYELWELAEYVELLPLTKEQQQIGLGRNCTLFDVVRKWAYKAVREHRGGTWGVWYAEVLERALDANTAFSEPLPYNEVKATAKSIAKYCWQKDTMAYNRFRERQQMKGSKGGLAKGRVYTDKREQADQLRQQGLKQKEIAEILCVSTRTLRNWRK